MKSGNETLAQAGVDLDDPATLNDMARKSERLAEAIERAIFQHGDADSLAALTASTITLGNIIVAMSATDEGALYLVQKSQEALADLVHGDLALRREKVQ